MPKNFDQDLHGTVTIRIKAGKYRIHAKKTNVNKSCKFTRTIKMKRRSVPGTFLRQGKKLRLRSFGRYNGSRYLLPATHYTGSRPPYHGGVSAMILPSSPPQRVPRSVAVWLHPLPR